MPDKPSQYEIPTYGGLTSQVHGWLLEAVQQGNAWLGAQRPVSEWTSVLELLSATGENQFEGQSNAHYNKSERIARELVASIGSFRHEGEFKPNALKSLYDIAQILNKCDEAWSRSTHSYLATRGILQYAVTKGTGYGVQTYDPHLYGPHRGDIKLEAFDPADITFLQLPRDHNVQRAYGVLIRYEMPINLAKMVYSRTNRTFAEQLTPDRDTPNWLGRGLEKVQRFLAPALRVAGLRPNDSRASFPTVDIYHLYTMDYAINDSGIPMTMGALGSNWQYIVPSLGDMVPTNVRNPNTGQMFTRPADLGDAMMFPLRRLSIFSRSVPYPCYDGSSPWWHGMVPVVKLRFNDWPFEALGRSLIGTIRSMQSSVSNIMRDVEDSTAARLNPPMVYDENLVSAGFADAFNPRRAGARAAANLSQGDLIKFPVAPTYYDVPLFIPEWIKYLDDRMEYLTGVRDMSSMAKAAQIPSADAIEKLLEAAGPLTQDMVRAVEEPWQQLGQMRLAYYYQFYTSNRYLTIAGDDTAQGEMDFQFRPELITPIVEGESPDGTTTRQRRYIGEFHYHAEQSGISELTRTTVKLTYLQLQKSGFPISMWTLAKVFQIPNFGPEPEGTNNEIERWVAEQRMKGELMADLQQEGAQPPGAPTQRGRPPTNAKPPRIEQKDGGARSTIATS